MINFSDITKAMVAVLSSDADLAALGMRIERSALLNEDPGRAPWCCVYKKRVGYAARVLGKGANNWMANPTIDIVVQSYSEISGEAAEDILEEYVIKVLAAVESDRTIGSTVKMVTGYDVEYLYNREDLTDQHFQMAVITVQLETRK